MESNVDDVPQIDKAYPPHDKHCCAIPRMWWYVIIAVMVLMMGYVLVQTAPRFTSNADRQNEPAREQQPSGAHDRLSQ